jgi:hypothetical protein
LFFFEFFSSHTCFFRFCSQIVSSSNSDGVRRRIALISQPVVYSYADDIAFVLFCD